MNEKMLKKFLYKKIWLLWLFYCLGILVLTPAFPVEASVVSYSILSDVGKHHRNTNFSMYFPTGLAPGAYQVPDISDGNYCFNANNITLHPYQIHISYSFNRDSKDDGNEPYFWIKKYKNGVDLGYLVYPTTSDCSGSINIGSNEYILCNMFTGDWDNGDWYNGHDWKAHECSFTVSYRIDNEAPDRPVPYVSYPSSSPQVRVINGVTYSSLKPTIIQWNNPDDNGTPPSGIRNYVVNINNQETLVGVNSLNTYSFENEGNYQIKIKARDYEENESQYSNTINLVVDYSVNEPLLSDIPIQIQSRELNNEMIYDVSFIWNTVYEATGIKYEAALSRNEDIPNDEEIISINTNQYTFANKKYSRDIYYAFVRAIDGLNNYSKWQRTSAFIIAPLPARFLSVQSHSELRNGQPYYEASFTMEEVDAPVYVIQRQTVGDASRTTLATFSKAQLASNGFSYIDPNLTPGIYIYYVYTKNELGARSPELMVVIPIESYEEKGDKQDPIYITEDKEWSGTVHLQGDLVVIPGEITLTILPGTQVIADKNCSLMIYGKMKADNVAFQSAPDATGRWRGIQVDGIADLNQATIEGAIRGLTASGHATVNITGCTFSQNQVGLHAYGAHPTVTGCFFLNNSIYGIKEDEGGKPVVVDCLFNGNGINYYQEGLTDISINELNQILGNGGNQ